MSDQQAARERLRAQHEAAAAALAARYPLSHPAPEPEFKMEPPAPLQGERGPRGIDGQPGPKGDKGDKGDRGDTGPEGPSGPQGLRGENGALGPAGQDAATDYDVLIRKLNELADRNPRRFKGLFSQVAVVGPQGPPGADGVSGSPPVTVTAGETVQAWRAVWVDTDGLAYLADHDDIPTGDKVLGISRSAALVGEPFVVAMDGDYLDTSPVTWTPGPLYVGDTGVLATTVPAAGWQLQMGTAMTTTQLLVRPQLPIDLV